MDDIASTKPETYTRESLESGLRDVRNGLSADASTWDQQCAVEALHRLGETARAGLEARDLLAYANHVSVCPQWIYDEHGQRVGLSNDRPCTCGLDALIERVVGATRSGRADAQKASEK